MKIFVHVTPNAKTSEVTKLDENSFKVRVDAAPIKGKANIRLLEILSEYFQVPKSSIRILKGRGSRCKLVEVSL
jgi:uncharacterized protein (TIGR00251 family)